MHNFNRNLFRLLKRSLQEIIFLLHASIFGKQEWGGMRGQNRFSLHGLAIVACLVHLSVCLPAEIFIYFYSSALERKKKKKKMMKMMKREGKIFLVSHKFVFCFSKLLKIEGGTIYSS